MQIDIRITEALDNFAELVVGSGGRIEALAYEEGRELVVGYDAGADGGCETCVISRQDLQHFIKTALNARSVPVDTVRVVDAPPAGSSETSGT